MIRPNKSAIVKNSCSFWGILLLLTHKIYQGLNFYRFCFVSDLTYLCKRIYNELPTKGDSESLFLLKVYML